MIQMPTRTRKNNKTLPHKFLPPANINKDSLFTFLT